ncbi:MAG: pseudouridine synthase [Planctomycetota bacterium]
MSQIRLHKFLANCGIASRRHSEELIRGGSVRVNNRIITEDGFLIDPAIDKIYYNDKLVRVEPKIYFIVNKPKGYVCTNACFKEPRVIDLFKTKQRLYTVGRLDKESEGLLIVTNDGELCQQVSHPSFEVPKTYLVTVNGYLDGAVLERVQKGIWLSEGKTGRTRIRLLHRARNFTNLQITLFEGKKREVRRIFAKFSYKIKQLKRIKIGNLFIGNLQPGQYRQISRKELESNNILFTKT